MKRNYLVYAIVCGLFALLVLIYNAVSYESLYNEDCVYSDVGNFIRL